MATKPSRGRRFYRAQERSGRSGSPGLLVTLGLLAACGGGDDPVDPATEPGQEAALDATGQPVFPPLTSYQPEYVPPEDGDLLPRWIVQVMDGGRYGRSFAMARIREIGPRAAPLLVPEIRARLHDANRFAELHNLCQALGFAGDVDAAPVLMEVLRNSSVPSARSAAVDSIAALEAWDLVPQLLEHVEIETEAGPALKIYKLLAAAETPEAVAFLEERTRAWLSGEATAEAYGSVLWTSILGLSDEGAVRRLTELGRGVALPLRVESLVRRIGLGDTDAAAELAPYVPAGVAPGPRVRLGAIQGLALAGDWEPLLAIVDDPDPKVVQNVVQGLRLQAAREADIGRAELQQLARHPDVEVALQAMQALVERGDRQPLEPWLRLARGYPHETGSVDAVYYLTQEGMRDPRTAPILIGTWEGCDVEERISVLRALAHLGDPAALDHYAAVIDDGAEDPEVRSMAVTQIANLGLPALDVLLPRWHAGARESEMRAYLAAFGRLIAGEGARAALLEITADESAPDLPRRHAFDLLPNALGAEAFAPLLAARDATQRSAVRAYLNRKLLEYY